MAERFVSNTKLIAEIRRSKTSYCYFQEAVFSNFTCAADSLDELVSAPLGSVVRVHTWEHIPLALQPNTRRRGEARAYESVNFTPFKHYLIGVDGPVEVGRSHWQGDLETGFFCATHGRLTNALGLMLMRTVENISMRGNWRNYSYRDEMVGDAITGLCANVLRYDDSKDTSAFAYITTITTNEMLKRLKREKLAQSVRDDLLEDAGAAPSMARQIEAELARFEPVKLVRTKRRPRHFEVDRFQRRSGRGSAPLVISTAATGVSAAPAAVARAAHVGAIVQINAAVIGQAPVPARARKPYAPRISRGPRPKRSPEVVAAVSAKLRAQREARVAAVLPLVEEARSNGCLLLAEICTYLDQIGHPSPQGKKWSHATLAQMLPKRTEADRQVRDDGFRLLMEQASSEGFSDYGEIAEWLNARGHRSSRGTAWSKGNVSRFLRQGNAAK